MESIGIYNLIVEVTRRCNISCNHCLRGNPLNMDMLDTNFECLCQQVNYITNLTITGGEPSLNVGGINDIIRILEQYSVRIGCFYIATNGVSISEEFVIACLKLYNLSDEKELCRVDVSNDLYHAAEDMYDTSLLGGLSFFW